MALARFEVMGSAVEREEESCCQDMSPLTQCCRKGTGRLHSVARWNNKLERGHLGVGNFHLIWLPELEIRAVYVYNKNSAIKL